LLEGVIVKYLLIVIIVSLITSFVARNKKKELLKNQDKDEFIVRLPKLYAWIGVIATILFLTFFVAMLIFPNGTGGFWVNVVFFGFVLFCGVFASGAIAWKIKVNINNDFFIYRTFFWRTYQIRYLDINKVRSTSYFLYLKFGNKRFFIDGTAYNFELFKSMLEKWKIVGLTTK
jgi:fatty acid desaturase